MPTIPFQVYDPKNPNGPFFGTLGITLRQHTVFINGEQQGRTRPSRNFETAGRPTVLSRYASGTSGGGRRSAPPYYAAGQCPSGCVYNGCIAARLPGTALGTRRWQPVAVTGLLPHDQSCAYRGCAGSRLLYGEYLPARARAISRNTGTRIGIGRGICGRIAITPARWRSWPCAG